MPVEGEVPCDVDDVELTDVVTLPIDEPNPELELDADVIVAVVTVGTANVGAAVTAGGRNGGGAIGP